MSKYHVQVERFIPVPAQQLFDIVADPQQHPRMDGSGSVQSVEQDVARKLSLGDTFRVGMKIGATYRMTNTVVEYEEGRRIAWQPRDDYVWRYTFTPANGGTVVTEEWDARTSTRRLLMGLLGFPRRNRKGIEQTLERLHQIAVDSEND